MNREHALKLVNMLDAAWPNWKPPTNTVELYIEFLKPIPDEVALLAVRDLIATGGREFAPPIGLILDKATEIAIKQTGYSLGNAEEAWGVVNDAIRFLGWYRGPGDLGGDSTLRRVVEALGWDRLCHDGNVAATQAHFMRLYNAYRDTEFQECKQRLIAGQPVLNFLPHTTPALENSHEE